MERLMYNENEVVTISLERYEELKKKDLRNEKESKNFDMVLNKMRDLGYLLVYRHEEDKFEIVLKEDWDREQADKSKAFVAAYKSTKPTDHPTT